MSSYFREGLIYILCVVGKLVIVGVRNLAILKSLLYISSKLCFLVVLDVVYFVLTFDSSSFTIHVIVLL